MNRRIFIKSILFFISSLSLKLFSFSKNDSLISFDYGVASGDPTNSHVILWTKVTSESHKDKKINWEVSSDIAFRNIVSFGSTYAKNKNDHTVKVDAGIPAEFNGKKIFYRFRSGDNSSEIGETSTLPINNPNKFKIGFCPQYGGFFSDLSTYENLKAIAQILLSDPREQNSKIEYLISKFELDYVRNIKASFLSGGQKKKLVIALALLGNPKILLLDECFAALDVLTIQMLQKIIVNLQTEERIGIIICDHQARDLLTCVDVAMILSNCKIIAQGTPKELINNAAARNAYFGEAFKIN